MKTYQFKLSVKDDNYDACKTANIKNVMLRSLAKWALTCYDGSVICYYNNLNLLYTIYNAVRYHASS
jgi:hypothetical protein